MKKLLLLLLALLLFLSAACGQAEPAAEAGSLSLSIRCDTLLDKADTLPAEKQSLLPEDGILYENTSAVILEGDSIFDVLQRELRTAGIPLDAKQDKSRESVYVEGIGNVYALDGGKLSGWFFFVNGESQDYSCSVIPAEDGDEVVFAYSCDLGADLGLSFE